MSTFTHTKLQLIQPSFDSELTDLIIELDALRRNKIEGTTHPKVFFQLKSIFQMLESIGSARIEGNNTTISDFIETKLEDREYRNESIEEIRNIERCIEYLHSMDSIRIDKQLLAELHSLLVEGLQPPPKGEGDRTPGLYRNHSIEIKGAAHKPPETQQQIEGYMQELFDFLNQKDPTKYDLLKIAQSHHRFMWIHPFGNGNGRVGRLLTYALLAKFGFGMSTILNPTAVFCIDRNAYYTHLSQADKGEEQGLIAWCTYVLSGLKSEFEKINNLLNYDYLKKAILHPALNYAKKQGYLKDLHYQILMVVVEKQTIQNSDIQPIMPAKSQSSISKEIKTLKEMDILVSEENSPRKYHLCVSNKSLIRGIIQKLENEGFIPMRIDE